MKIFSLIRAMFSEDMNIFAYKTKASGAKKMILPVALALLIMVAVGNLVFPATKVLMAFGMAELVPVMAVGFATVFSLMEGIYKAQGILFEAKDNDLLFALPIKRSAVLYTRILKLLTFQFLFNLIFLVPSFLAYAWYVRPGVGFYGLALLYMILTPIVPTVVAGVLAYVVKMITARFKAKRAVQTIMSFVVALGVIAVSMNMNGLTGMITEHGAEIEGVLTQIYFPIGALVGLIKEFDVMTLVGVLAFSLVPLAVFVMVGAKWYFQIIAKTSEVGGKVKRVKVEKVKMRSQMVALVGKEVKKFFASSVLIFNSLFGVLLMIVVTGFLIVKGPESFDVAELEEVGISAEMIMGILPKLFCVLIVFVGTMTSITSSSISLEGKSVGLTKSLPVPAAKILVAKALMSDVIVLPMMLVVDAAFALRFGVGGWDLLMIVAYTLIVPTFAALLGVVVNLKYPKLEFTSEAEVVKQSTSTMVSTMLGVILAMAVIVLTFFMLGDLTVYLAVVLGVFAVLDVILWRVMTSKWAEREWMKL